jgi:sporulation protein YqfC
MKKEKTKPKELATSKAQSIVGALKLPKDVCLGALRVTLNGSLEAWIENYKGILEYSQERILLQAKTCQVCFEGSRLRIEYYTYEDMKISGNIQCVRYI